MFAAKFIDLDEAIEALDEEDIKKEISLMQMLNGKENIVRT